MTAKKIHCHKVRQNPGLTSTYLQKELAASGVNVHDSTIQHRLLGASCKTMRPQKKQLLTTMKTKWSDWVKKNSFWMEKDREHVLLSDEMQGEYSYHVRKSSNETVSLKYVDQSKKRPGN